MMILVARAFQTLPGPCGTTLTDRHLVTAAMAAVAVAVALAGRTLRERQCLLHRRAARFPLAHLQAHSLGVSVRVLLCHLAAPPQGLGLGMALVGPSEDPAIVSQRKMTKTMKLQPELGEHMHLPQPGVAERMQRRHHHHHHQQLQ